MSVENPQATDFWREDIERGLTKFGHTPETSSRWAAQIVSFLEEGPSGWSAKWDGGTLRLDVPLDSSKGRNRVELWFEEYTMRAFLKSRRTIVYARNGIYDCRLKQVTLNKKQLVFVTNGENRISFVRDASTNKTDFYVEVA